MQLRFTKMHGLGNDFVVVDLITQRFKLKPHHIRKLADRHFGVGCDQVLAVEIPTRPDVDFRYRIYNAEGSEVEQCGNGARCFARYVVDKRLTGKQVIRVETLAGVIELELAENRQVRVDMGQPILEPAQIPFQAEAQAEYYPLEIDGQSWQVGAVSMGNPHVVLPVDNVDTAPVAQIGPIAESHPRFPQRVNVGFMQIINRDKIRLRVFERGVGETLACGTGACAAAVAGIVQGHLNDTVTVELPGGALSIHWSGPGHPVIMTGPATTVFEGQIQV
ncbi:MAG: diaminopimelate epimerase [Spongiibacter sp.]|uniref:Diaminopimelate epimerase n=1 Tax=Spongiibacter thalassae TaxID=2721624 RepID=A0ABX1GI57_9GAMM|nr:diaminopimelate epimerase [Spongiibacter thalassae]MDX1505788.1 diaminopimelate epimerase [Spongiibacter sp.]NKI18157.1 diaminopimelate epimerase [Spongiibacter thalassae]